MDECVEASKTRKLCMYAIKYDPKSLYLRAAARCAARGQKRPKGSSRRSTLVRGKGTRGATKSVSQAAANPREAAKRSGTPNSRIVTRAAGSGRALRANRCAHVRR